LTDELAQMHKSPGFITSNLVGVAPDGTYIKEFEASHGTVTDMDEARLRGEETSLNPLGMVEGLIGAMNHASFTHDTKENHKKWSISPRAFETSCTNSSAKVKGREIYPARPARRPNNSSIASRTS